MTDRHAHHFDHQRYLDQKQKADQRNAEVQPSDLRNWTGKLNLDQQSALKHSGEQRQGEGVNHDHVKTSTGHTKIPAPVSAEHTPFAEFFKDKVKPQETRGVPKKPLSEKARLNRRFKAS